MPSIALSLWTLVAPFSISLVASAAPSSASPPATVEDASRSGATIIEFPNSITRVAIWEQNGQAGYGISIDGNGLARVTNTDYDLRLRFSQFDPLAAQPVIPQGLAVERAEAATHDVFIVQFWTQPLVEYRDALEAIGGTIHATLHRHSYLVRLEIDAIAEVEALPFVRWVGDYHPAYKLDESIVAFAHSGTITAPAAPVHVQVFEKGPAQKAIVAARITELGGTIDAMIPDGYLIRATLTGEQIRLIAKMSEVAWVNPWGPPENDMNIVRQVGGANELEMVAGYTGAGVRAEVMDGGLDLSHPDFQHNPPLTHGAVSGDASHGTPCYGINFGSGDGLASARGVVPDAQGIFSDYGFLSNRYVHTSQLNQSPYFAVYQSNSWGNQQTTAYTSISMQMDDILFDHDVVLLQSQSNTGDQNSRPQAWAKNIVSVGGIIHQGTASLDDDCWCGAASIGPAADGRVKPDISFYNDGISTTGDGNGYTSFGGTSAATPEAAGFFGLFYQMWSDGVFGNDVDPKGTVFENRPHMTTAKAMMINAARSYEFTSPNADLRRTHQGWGLPDVAGMYDRRARYMVLVDETDVLQNLQSTIYEVPVEYFAGALRATLVYADLPGTTSSNLHRINDLTLKATSPSGEVYWGNNGLLDGIWSQPGGVANEIDTVENIFLETPEFGLWTIEVIASDINQDSHVETPQLDADYALVVNVEGSNNDMCTGPPLLGDGSYFVANVTATSSGPFEAACGEFEADIWYRYIAVCEGTVSIDVCDADFDSQLAVYTSCPDGPDEFVACNDDFCGTGSQVSFETSPSLYYIRIGGAPGEIGSATLTVTCTAGAECLEDLDDDGSVGIADLLELLAAWGTDPGGAPDFDGNGDVDVNDLLQMLAVWGECE